jgi:hypothetical protein
MSVSHHNHTSYQEDTWPQKLTWTMQTHASQIVPRIQSDGHITWLMATVSACASIA